MQMYVGQVYKAEILTDIEQMCMSYSVEFI